MRFSTTNLVHVGDFFSGLLGEIVTHFFSLHGKLKLTQAISFDKQK